MNSQVDTSRPSSLNPQQQSSKISLSHSSSISDSRPDYTSAGTQIKATELTVSGSVQNTIPTLVRAKSGSGRNSTLPAVLSSENVAVAGSAAASEAKEPVPAAPGQSQGPPPAPGEDESEAETESMRTSAKSSLYIALAMAGIFIAICVIENPVESVYRMHNTIMTTYLSTYC